jgi:hypothetical protein
MSAATVHPIAHDARKEAPYSIAYWCHCPSERAPLMKNPNASIDIAAKNIAMSAKANVFVALDFTTTSRDIQCDEFVIADELEMVQPAGRLTSVDYLACRRILVRLEVSNEDGSGSCW